MSAKGRDRIDRPLPQHARPRGGKEQPPTYTQARARKQAKVGGPTEQMGSIKTATTRNRKGKKKKKKKEERQQRTHRPPVMMMSSVGCTARHMTPERWPWYDRTVLFCSRSQHLTCLMPFTEPVTGGAVLICSATASRNRREWVPPPPPFLSSQTTSNHRSCHHTLRATDHLVVAGGEQIRVAVRHRHASHLANVTRQCQLHAIAGGGWGVIECTTTLDVRPGQTRDSNSIKSTIISQSWHRHHECVDASSLCSTTNRQHRATRLDPPPAPTTKKTNKQTSNRATNDIP